MCTNPSLTSAWCRTWATSRSAKLGFVRYQGKNQVGESLKSLSDELLPVVRKLDLCALNVKLVLERLGDRLSDFSDGGALLNCLGGRLGEVGIDDKLLK